MTTAQEWRVNRKTHDWVTLDGENWSCSWCDTKTGSEPCPLPREDFDEQAAALREHPQVIDQAGWADDLEVPGDGPR